MLIFALIPILSFGGFGGEDVGKLYPVQAVMICAAPEGVQITTDGGQVGKGRDVHAALEDLNATADAQVFLDTAEYLLLEPGMENRLSQLQPYLRPSCSLCLVSNQVTPAEAVRYLQLREPQQTLIQYEAGQRQLPTLIYNEGRMKLV